MPDCPQVADRSGDANGASRGGAPSGLRIVAVLARLTAPERLAFLSSEWKLTPREREVFAHLVQGATNKRIASALGCKKSTASVHVMNITVKAGLRTRGAVLAVYWNVQCA